MPEHNWRYLKSGVKLAGKKRIKAIGNIPANLLPPTFVTAGEWEITADSIVNWAHKVQKEGAPDVELKVRFFFVRNF
jgi:acetyl esterase/lipase